MGTSEMLPQPPQAEDTLSSFDSIPLFMKSLPDDASDNPIIGALQSLAHDGTPDEIAQNFKEQGNDYFKGRRYREALGFYTQGVDANPTDKSLLEALLCNRAACNLELKNYGSVLKDCSKAIQTNAHSSKAYYRSALALIALDRPEEALDCCDRCLAFDKDNKAVQATREKAEKLAAAKAAKEEEKQRKILAEKINKQRLRKAYEERNFIVVQGQNEHSGPTYSPYFDPEDPTFGILIVPVFLLYPQYATSDLIEHYVEDTPFSAHISTMFPPNAEPPEWDKQREYVDGQLVVYAMTHRKRLLKVGKKMSLRDVYEAAKGKEGEPKDGLELKDGCLTFVVLPKGEVEQKWIEDFKKSRDG